MRLGRTIAAMLMVQFAAGCLYTEEIGPPPPETENSPPYFSNWLPSSTTVTIGPSGQTFIVYYDDENDAVDQLEIQWYLDGRARGNGNQVKIWIEDLGQEGSGVLVANVQDPHDASDSLLWRLEVEPQLSEGE